MGDIGAVDALLKVAPNRENDQILLRSEADVLFYGNDYARVCPLVASQIRQVATVYWRKAFIFCQALAGEHDRASLGVTLLQEQGEEDPVFYNLIDALAGLKRGLSVHRVNGQSVWELEHRVGEQIELRLDGVPSTMGAIAVGFERKTVDLGPIQVGIGSTVLTAWLGLIDADGDGGITLPVSPAALGLKIYTQAFVDDLRGATGEILTSNVIGVEITP